MERILTPNSFNMRDRKYLVVGISGATCGGKTTLSKLLHETFPWAKVVHQDAYFHPNDPKFHVYLPEIDFYDWELETALDFERMENDVKRLVAGGTIPMSVCGTPFFENMDFVRSHKPTQAEADKYLSQFSDIQLIILEGHIIFNRTFFDDICDQKFFLTMGKDECERRRQQRVYEPMPPSAFFELCVWPSYEQRHSNVQHLDGITFLDAEQIQLLDMFMIIKTRIVDSLSKMKMLNDNWL